jgi:hypothetical protein
VSKRELLRDHVSALFVARDGKVTRSYATAQRHGGVIQVTPHGSREFRDVALRMHLQEIIARGEVKYATD